MAGLEAAPRLDIDFDQLAAENTERMAQTAAAVERRFAELRDRFRKDAQNRTATPGRPHTPHQQDQAQSAAHQHHNTGNRTPGQ
ncbi:hypothetical protein [Streptomyces zaomyceticus]|uniref:Uncharacterized protein n=1 Tax=Streptomyces zaomyceticus TaxID=68286 RepID=A0ABZ1LSJ5_9ACTN